MYSDNWHCDILISFGWGLLFGSFLSSYFHGNLWSLAFEALEIRRATTLDWLVFLSSRYLPYQILLYDILSLWSAYYFLSGPYQVCLLSSHLSCASWYAFSEKSYADTCLTCGSELPQFNDLQYYMCSLCVIRSNFACSCLHNQVA